MLAFAFVYLITGTYIFLPTNFDTARAVGNLVGVSLLIYLIIKLINRNKSEETKDKGFVALGMIAILWVTLVLYKEVSDHRSLNNFVATIEKGDVSKLEPSLPSNIKVPGYSGNDADGTQILLNEVLIVLKPYSLEIEKNQAELEKVGIDQILSAQMFNSRSAITNGFQKLDKWTYFVNEESRLINEAYKAQIIAIEKASVSPEIKASFLKGLNKSVDETTRLYKLQTNATHNSIAIARKILKLAESNIGLVQVTANGVIFPKPQDNEAYAQAIQAIQKEAQDEQKYAAARSNYQQSVVNRMKNTLSK
ncbi:hypothetical protein ICV01_06305 [Polynucleobacter sp. MWH-Spelu-300-X4]|uniref:hypothetical protein n=1 Tax=Polynucleobacter sp. MWH-Spelu-300-X4 TaxID=2689109 RepID=UPI001BFDD436|nr:hypothetical protein [Polynucleobacter sp. MWH-Spelu-300-X4]QWD79260.1 hypothetical protein ICV01_06305 [Polynucleobacter sp. MWH-Spelu-300-X4]